MPTGDIGVNILAIMKINQHRYEYDVDVNSNSAPANVVQMVGRDKCVLEVGCGPGSITRILFERGNCQVTGLEVDPDAIRKVSPYCHSVHQVDLNTSDWPVRLNLGRLYDVVVAADVLEHLYSPEKTLEQLATFVAPSGYLVISLPHVAHAAVIASLMVGQFNYRNWGLLDSTHIRFFGLGNMETMFGAAGLKVIEARYVLKRPEDTEFADIWAKLPYRTRKELMAIDHAAVYQIVVKLVPVDRLEESVPLRSPVYRWRPSSQFSPMLLLNHLKKSLSPHAKRQIRKALGRIGVRV